MKNTYNSDTYFRNGEFMKKQICSLLLGMFLFVNGGISIAADNCIQTEHLKQNKEVSKKSPTDIVITTPNLSTIIEYNVIELEYAQDFSSKTAKVGDRVGFLLNSGLQTREGTMVVPCGSRVEAEVISVKKPKSFNRSGKVVLCFDTIVMPNGCKLPLKAKVYAKKQELSRGKLNAMGKGLGGVLGTAAVATGAGCGIGVAAGAVVVGGLAIGLPVGVAVGAIGFLCTPGLHYKAKPGDKLYIQLTDNLELQN